MANTASLLPPNATRTERALAQANASIGDIPTPVRSLWNPDNCPATLLPWLAWSFGVEQWDSAWSEEQKRSTIKSALFIQRHKGTIGAVRSVLTALGFSGQVQEWFNQIPAGAPYTFRLLLEASQDGFSQAALDQLLNIVENTKNLRSHLTEIAPEVKTRNQMTTAAVASMGNEMGVAYGLPDPYLMVEGAVNGITETELAVNSLHALLHTTMPGANYW